MNPKDLTTEQLIEIKEIVDKELHRRVRKLADVAGIVLKSPRKVRTGRQLDE